MELQEIGIKCIKYFKKTLQEELMKKPVEQALVDQYLKKIQVQATKENEKTDIVYDAIKQIIAEANTHFDLVAKNSETKKEVYNVALKNQLTSLAQRTHSSQPKRKAVFEYAASLIN